MNNPQIIDKPTYSILGFDELYCESVANIYAIDEVNPHNAKMHIMPIVIQASLPLCLTKDLLIKNTETKYIIIRVKGSAPLLKKNTFFRVK